MSDDGRPARSIAWIARLVDPDALADARRLAIALGLAVLVDEPHKLMTQTADGAVLEFCTPDQEVPAHLFAGDRTVVGFEVDDLDRTVATLEAAGFPPLSPAHAAGGVRFQHVRGPGGVTYGLIEPD